MDARSNGRLRGALAALLTEARARTLLLVAPLADEDLRAQHDPLMSPILWDLGHIAHYEETWLVRALGDAGDAAALSAIYDPIAFPRAVRARLPLPSRDACLETMARVRRRALELLEGADLDGPPLLRDGYAYQMVLAHECQHQETILQTLQLKRGEPYRAPRAITLPARASGEQDGMVFFPGGEIALGTDDRSAAYDNERPRHVASLEPFWIDALPVTNGAFEAFIDAGGYERRELWSEAGWLWLGDARVRAPLYWTRERGEWLVRTMDAVTPLDRSRPVCHVSWHEAEAFARFAGKRLPSEAEWEAAASWDPASGEKRAFPWGEEPPTASIANLDQLAFGTAPAGAYPRNVSPIGCRGMIGDVWEWTASDFAPYPGFEPFPYEEYSQVFFGDRYKVLRGGSWATRPSAVRATFRNWDFPVRRQIFSGFRCAREA
jgi:iron(II)-dependent oxidoreductase